MNRKEFIKVCGISCLGIIGLPLVPSCKPTKHVQGSMNGRRLQIAKKEFEIVRKERISYRRTVLSKPENSDFPIAVYRFSETEYHAVLLRCTHQSSELSLNGDILSCPAHGSEFNNRGDVLQGPAEQKLETFTVTSDEKNIYIHLF